MAKHAGHIGSQVNLTKLKTNFQDSVALAGADRDHMMSSTAFSRIGIRGTGELKQGFSIRGCRTICAARKTARIIGERKRVDRMG